MTAIIDNKVVSCLAEMERLKEKIKALNKEKQERAATKEKKIRDTEPNMAVLEDWLSKKDQVEYDKMSKKAIEDYKTLDTREHPRRFSPDYQELLKKYKQEEYDIMVNYHKYHGQRNSGYGHELGSINVNEIKVDRPVQKYLTFQGPFMKDFIEATHNLFQIQQKRIDELEIKLQAQHHTPRQLEYMAHKRASRFKAHLAEKIHTGSPEQYKGCGGSCAICLEDMTSGGMCYKLNTGGMEHVFHRVCGEQQM